MKYLGVPVVQRIETDDGSHIEPPLGSDWSESDKIAWAAAVCAADTGLTVEAFEHPGGGYSFRLGRHQPYNSDAMRVGTINSGGPYAYEVAWIYLNAVEAGVLANRQTATTQDQLRWPSPTWSSSSSTGHSRHVAG